METVTLNSGDHMPQFGLGTWLSDREKLHQAVKHALELGYCHIDCAAIYLNEDVVGAAVSESIGQGIVKREDLWLTSKLWNSYHRAKDVRATCEQSLKDLRVDYLDLYLIHWPVAFNPSVGMSAELSGVQDLLSLEEVPLMETWRAMEALVNEGLVKNIGVSNFSKRHLKTVLDHCHIQPCMNQIESHPYWQQKGMRQFCQDHNMHITAYAPLGSRAKHTRFPDDNVAPDLFEDTVIKQVATKYQATPAQVLIAWQLTRGVIAIPKSVTPARIEENFAAKDLQLDAQDREAINNIQDLGRSFDAKWWDVEGSPYTQAVMWD